MKWLVIVRQHFEGQNLVLHGKLREKEEGMSLLKELLNQVAEVQNLQVVQVLVEVTLEAEEVILGAEGEVVAGAEKVVAVSIPA